MKGAILAVLLLFVNAEAKSGVQTVTREEARKLLFQMREKYQGEVEECSRNNCGSKKGGWYDMDPVLIGMRKGNVSIVCLDKCILRAYENFISAVQSTVEELNLYLWMLKHNYASGKTLSEYHKRLGAIEQIRQSHQSSLEKPLQWDV